MLLLWRNIIILRNSVNNKFTKFVKQQLKITNYSELDFSFIINLQCQSFSDSASESESESVLIQYL